MNTDKKTMSNEEQLVLLRKTYLEKINILYTEQFRIKLTAVYSYDKKWYELHLHRIDILSSAMEHTIMENNPRRAMRYLCLLSISIKKLIGKTEADYEKKLKTRI